MKAWLSLLALCCAALLHSARAQQQPELVSTLCLGCICEASTACNLNFGCANGYCGPFLLSQPFFSDSKLAEEPSFAGQTFASCSADPYCSAAAIRKYMTRFPRDCDGDGVRTCSDFAMVHKTGPGGCVNNQAALSSEYWQRFQSCLSHFPNA